MKISSLSTVDRVEALIKFLESQPNDEVFIGSEIESKLGFSVDSGSFRRARQGRLRNYAEVSRVPGHCRATVYGNPRAIKALRKEMGIA